MVSGVDGTQENGRCTVSLEAPAPSQQPLEGACP
jgi:hypothetical protein